VGLGEVVEKESVQLLQTSIWVGATDIHTHTHTHKHIHINTLLATIAAISK